MKQILIRHVRVLALCVSCLFLLIAVAACSSTSNTGANGNTVVITGMVQSVNPTNHSVTISLSGQSYTINGLTDAQVTQLQSQIGKSYKITATQNADGSYTIAAGTNPVADTNGTPGIATPNNTNNPGANQPGNISYIGKVQNVNPSSIQVSLPNGDSLTMNINALTDHGNFGTGLPQNGQLVNVKATTLTDGNFTAASLDVVKPDDANDPTTVNTVEFNGVTTSAVGADNVVHFRIGSKDFNYTVNPATTKIKDFASLQSIPVNTFIKLDVLFNGSNGTVLKVANGSN